MKPIGEVIYQHRVKYQYADDIQLYQSTLGWTSDAV